MSSGLYFARASSRCRLLQAFLLAVDDVGAEPLFER
jgi:hypothetical protein